MKQKDIRFSLLAAPLVVLLSWPTIVNVLPELSGGTHFSIAIVLGVLTLVGLFVTNLLARWAALFWQLGKFVVVGGLNTFLDFAILNLLISATGIAAGIGYSVFKATSFIAAVINSYFWNKYWTFESGSKAAQDFPQFVLVSAIGIGVNVGIATILTNVTGPLFGLGPVVWANAAAFVATIMAWVWNFLGYKFFVFKKRA